MQEKNDTNISTKFEVRKKNVGVKFEVRKNSKKHIFDEINSS